MSLQSPCWDFTLEIIGPVSAQIDAAFALQWQRIGLSLHLLMPRKDPPSVKYAKAAPRVAAHTIEQPSVAFIVRDNFFNRRAIEKAYLMAIRHAQREILLANPYFIPGRRLRRALMRAARRGVDVRLLIGRKEFMLLDCAVPHLYRTLLYAGVRIAEYEKTLLHGKVAVIDSTWATVGSSNLDALSLVLNHEANIVLVKHPEIAALREAISKAFNEARLIDAAHYAARSWGERLLNWLAYTMYRAVMKVLTIGGYD